MILAPSRPEVVIPRAAPSCSFGDNDAEDPDILDVATFSQRLVNDGGSREGIGNGASHQPAHTEGGQTGVIFIMLTGEGGYEDLTLILSRSGDEGRGWIVPTSSVSPSPELLAE